MIRNSFKNVVFSPLSKLVDLYTTGFNKREIVGAFKEGNVRVFLIDEQVSNVIDIPINTEIKPHTLSQVFNTSLYEDSKKVVVDFFGEYTEKSNPSGIVDSSNNSLICKNGLLKVHGLLYRIIGRTQNAIIHYLPKTRLVQINFLENGFVKESELFVLFEGYISSPFKIVVPSQNVIDMSIIASTLLNGLIINGLLYTVPTEEEDNIPTSVFYIDRDYKLVFIKPEKINDSIVFNKVKLNPTELQLKGDKSLSGEIFVTANDINEIFFSDGLRKVKVNAPVYSGANN